MAIESQKKFLLGDILAHLGGAYLPILNQNPSERSKYITIGLFVFNTAILAFITMNFALSAIFRDGTHFILIAIVAFVWAFIILSIDWGLVKTMKKEEHISWTNYKTYTGLIIPTLLRIIAAGLISFTISKPFEVKVFEPRLKPKIEEMKATYLLSKFNELDSINRLNTDLETIQTNQQRADSVMNQRPDAVVEYDDRIENKRSEIIKKRNSIVSLETENANLWKRLATKYCAKTNALGECSYWKWHCTDATYIANTKRIKDLRKEIGDIEKKEIKPIEAQRDSFLKIHINTYAEQSRIFTEQAARRAEVERYRDSVRKIQDSLIRAGAEAGFRDNYLMAQIEALETLSADPKESNSIFWCKWLIFASIFIIDLMPIIIKLLSPFGTYEKSMKLLEEENNFQLRLRSALLFQEYKTNRGLISKLASSQQTIIQDALQKWQEEQIDKINSQGSNLND